jgi:hypothetical protein
VTRKTAEDLDEEYGAIGGAMSKWPLRTIAWTCRDARINAADPAVVEALLDREADDLTDLAALAERVGIDAGGLRAKRDAIDAADADGLLAVLGREYRAEHGGGGADWDDGGKCPFEESGLDKACWRCPVPGNALEALAADAGEPADDRDEVEA